MVLNGRATEALTFYQEAFAGDILFKITNQEFKERLNPSLTIPAGEEHWLSHSILQMDTFQLQLADNPLFAGMNTTPTEQLTLSLTVNSRHSAKTIFEKLTRHPESCIIQEPIENEFAAFYAIVKDPFGLVTQITQENKQILPRKEVSRRMRTYESKEALIEAIQIASQKYLAEFAEIPETLKDHRIETVAKTPSENLAYQLGWLNLLLSWEEQEQRGLTVQTPAEGYKWNQLGALYQSFYQTYGQMSLESQLIALQDILEKLLHWIDSLSEDELFYLNNGLGRLPKHNGLFEMDSH